jgi:hypothetical protein
MPARISRPYVNEDALKRIQPDLRSDEAGILAALHMTAVKVYRRGRTGSYELIPLISDGAPCNHGTGR